MTVISPPTAADSRLIYLVRTLRAAPGIARYTDVFPRLWEKHLLFLGDTARTPRSEAARFLTSAGRSNPPELEDAAHVYRQRGELPALRLVTTDADTITRVTVEWQRRTDELVGKAESLAALCDAEGVPCRVNLTWAKQVRQTRELVSGDYAESPASQQTLLQDRLSEMQRALDEEKQSLQERLGRAEADLSQKQPSLDEKDAVQAQDYVESVAKLIAGDKLIPALRKLGLLDGLLTGRVVRSTNEGGQRLPLPRRRNPLGRSFFHFEGLTRAARLGAGEAASCGLADYFPNEAAVQEAAEPSGFLSRHAARRVPDWSSYWAVFRDWLGLDDPRTRKDDRQRRRARRLQRVDMPNLEPKGERLPGRWIFLPVEAWQGAPYYEDPHGRPRTLAVVRLAVADTDRARPQVILQYVSQVLRDLLVQLPAETEDEWRFRREGLVIVLLPGESLSGRKYDQFRQQVQLEKSAQPDRVAYLDDLDLLRVLPVPLDDRFRALLEVALPRFPKALSHTYQNSDAVRPRMFFGRSDELARLERDNGVTVVFSGRKMGKSSLLSRLQAQCTIESGQRAVMVGCSGITKGRSWAVLLEIERELQRLLRADERTTGSGPSLHLAGAVDDPDHVMEAAKQRFRAFIDTLMQRLEGEGVRRLYVLLDEADNFIRAELEETSGSNPRAAISWFLRDLQTSTYRGRLRFIFAGYDQVGQIFRDPGLGHSAFANWGELLKLKPLDPTDARELVAGPLTSLGMLVRDDVVERILDYTSGHASLIQAFCRKLGERVRETQADWPLNDAPVEFEDVQAVADDQRGAAEQTYRQMLEQTLGLNLDIARAYPLKLIFLALLSPTGFGAGRILGWDRFTLEDTLEQLRTAEGELVADLPQTLVFDSLDLLAQLGLLEEVTDEAGRYFSFKARHYVNVLRTKNEFQAQLQQALEEWQQSGRRVTQVEPRYVWTLPDSDLRALRQATRRPAVVIGLPGSGRGYLAEMLRASFVDTTVPDSLSADDDGFADRFEALLEVSSGRPVVIADPADRIAWQQLAEWLRRAESARLPLRWLGGPRLAWELAEDLESALLIDGPYCLGPLTPAELEPWAARPLGIDMLPSAVSIPDPERGPLLKRTGGLLPILEMFREWLLNSKGGFPDPLRQQDAERFFADLTEKPARAAQYAERLARELPLDLRLGLHHLFQGAHEYGYEEYQHAEMVEISEHLRALKTDDLSRLLDAASWLGLLRDGGAAERKQVPHQSVLGLLIRHPRFAAP
jgi:hypothetical protein